MAPQTAGGAIVEPERVVNGGGEMEPLAHDRNELAIAGVPRALDRVAFDDGLGDGFSRCEEEQQDTGAGYNSVCCEHDGVLPAQT
jgi:hypothetical protein